MTLSARAGSAIAKIAGVALLALPVIWQLDPGRLMSSGVNLEQFATAELTLALVYIYASRISGARHAILRAGLLCCVVLAVGVGALLIRHYGSASSQFIFPTPETIAIALVLAVLTLTACWAASGMHFFALIILFLIFGYSMQFVGGVFATPAVSLKRYVIYLTFGGEGFLGNALRVISDVVVVFIGFGVVMNLTGATGIIEKIAVLATRRSRGAAIKVAVLASAMFGTISGSATSNVMTSGSFSIASMRRLGLSGAQAGGVEAVASTLGQVIPPIMGAAAFLMADFTGQSYLTVASAAAVPALFCIAVLFLCADSIALSLPAQPREQEVTGHGLVLKDLVYLLPLVGIAIALTLRSDQVAYAGIHYSAKA
jgi:TRAP-type uncharacterized transport system fused permease subunit